MPDWEILTAVKEGDIVDYKNWSGKWQTGRVVRFDANFVNVVVRKVGRTKSGIQFRLQSFPISRMRRPFEFPPEPANVFADWLEENGEARAAEKLRQAFPLWTKEEVRRA